MATAADARGKAAGAGRRVTATAIDGTALLALIHTEIRLARRDGVCHIRDADGFAAHLLSVGRRAAAVASRLHALPPSERPDPVAVFVAGAWHDGGKIRNGDDYHEITSAVEVLERGLSWGLVDGPRMVADRALRRAARAIVPHFAVNEQWSSTYTPTTGNRERIVPTLARLRDALADRNGPAGERALLLPTSVDALVVMYADLIEGDEAFDACFESRWMDIERRARQDDPAIVDILPDVRPRVYAGCALVERFLARGYDDDALQRFRAGYCGGATMG